MHASPIHGLSRAAAKSRRIFLQWDIWTSILALRDVSKPSMIVELILGIDLSQLFKLELVSQHSTNATKAFDELVGLARRIGDEFEGCVSDSFERGQRQSLCSSRRVNLRKEPWSTSSISCPVSLSVNISRLASWPLAVCRMTCEPTSRTWKTSPEYHREVLIGLYSLKSILIFRSLPSEAVISPQ